MRLRISSSKEREVFLNFDHSCFWLTEEVPADNKEGKVERNLTGYYQSLVHLFRGFSDEETRRPYIKDLADIVRKQKELHEFIEETCGLLDKRLAKLRSVRKK